jgi:type I restriction enzyme M protein
MMLTDPRLKSQVDSLWDAFWTGGLTNPLDAIEQFTYLLFLKRLDDHEKQKQKRAAVRGLPYTAQLPETVRWDTWARMPAKEALHHLKTAVFPELRHVGDPDSPLRDLMRNAECKINKPNLLVQAVSIINEMQIGQQQQDVQGDLYEYLLSKLNTAGRNGQFRTPRHIIRMMVLMLNPQPTDRMGDLAAGTAGFLVNAYLYILEQHTSPETLTYDEEGWPHNLVGDLLTAEQWAFLHHQALHGYDNDSGMTMLRIGAMNLMLHGIDNPNYRYADTLSEEYDEPNAYDKIFMNPPFKGAVDRNAMHPALKSAATTKSELLFLHRIWRALDMGGQAAVIVPDGVLFGSSGATWPSVRSWWKRTASWAWSACPAASSSPMPA